jgi:hypothetical protein
MSKQIFKNIFVLTPQLLTMRAVFLPAGVGFVLSNTHWEYTRNKTAKKTHINFDFGVPAAPRSTVNHRDPGVVKDM